MANTAIVPNGSARRTTRYELPPESPSRAATVATVATPRAELDRVIERRRAVAVVQHYRYAEGLRSRRLPSAWPAHRRRSRPTCTTLPGRRLAPSRRAISVSVAAAAPTGRR